MKTRHDQLLSTLLRGLSARAMVPVVGIGT